MNFVYWGYVQLSCKLHFILIVYLKILLDFLHKYSFHLQIMIVLFFSFLILLPFVSCLTVLARTYSTNRNDKNVFFFFFSYSLSAKAFNISSLNMIAVGFSYIPLFSFIPKLLTFCFVSCFIMNRAWTSWTSFSTYSSHHINFLLYSFNIVITPIFQC